VDYHVHLELAGDYALLQVPDRSDRLRVNGASDASFLERLLRGCFGKGLAGIGQPFGIVQRPERRPVTSNTSMLLF
jgi:hypothetical protein